MSIRNVGRIVVARRNKNKHTKVVRLNAEIKPADGTEWMPARIIVGSAVTSDLGVDKIKLICQTEFKTASWVEIKMPSKDAKILKGFVVCNQATEYISGINSLTGFRFRVEVSFAESDEETKKALTEFFNLYTTKYAA